MRCAGDRTRAGRLSIVTATFACFAALLAGCSDDPSSPRPRAISKLTVVVSTSGDDVDADGYFVIIDRSSQPQRVQANGRVAFYGLAVGSHSVDLTEVEPNCVVDGGSATVTISAPGAVADMDLHVTCSALGSVRVTVATTGTDVDANGYTVVASATG